jgi:hypothetical protein
MQIEIIIATDEYSVPHARRIPETTGMNGPQSLNQESKLPVPSDYLT